MDNKSGVNFCAGCGNPLSAQQSAGGPQQKMSGSQPYGQLYTHQQTGGAPQSYGPEGYRQMGGGAQPFGPGGIPAAPVKDYMAHNIVMTILGALCCNIIAFVLGIVGIVFASNSRKAAAMGDFTTAQSAANTAKIMYYISLALIILTVVAYILIFLAGGLASMPGFPGRRL